MQEAATGVITLDDDDPAVLDRVIKYLYLLDYSDEETIDFDPSIISESPKTLCQ